MQSNKSNGQLTAQISVNDHKKSGFDLSNNVLGTGQIGRIIPTRALHVMPADTINQDSKVAVQFEPLAVPILANMDVKQEHFYVPYNVVWKNWDKFISGGEKMDYKGVVPNVDMVTIVQTVVGKLPKHVVSFTAGQVIAGQRAYYGVSQFDSLESYSLPISLKAIGDAYYINDLLKPQREVLDLMYNRLGEDKDFCKRALVLVTSSSSVDDAISAYKTYLSEEGLLGDKYLNQLQDVFVNDILIHQNTLMPSSDFMEYMHMVYDYYRSFIGYSSNIDYLNMGRVSFVEFLYAVISDINSWYANSLPFNQYQILNDATISLFSTKPMSILHLRANYSVWFNNYRDILLESNAMEPVIEDMVSENELFVLLVPRQRCWEKDAFTTALDNPGTGNVYVPTGDVNSLDMQVEYLDIPAENKIVTEGIENNMDITKVTFNGKSWEVPTAFLRGVTNAEFGSTTDSCGGFSLYALDAAQRAQKWLQKALYFGNRISDFYYMRFGVRFLDSRLRLPELLTSSSELVKIDVIMNNTTTAESVAGDRAGYASAYDSGNSFKRFIEEHGVILSYLTIMPQVTYAYGSCRDYSRIDQFDFAFSEFATLGMDAVYSDEITASSLQTSQPLDVFGYQGKYYDYKAKHSEEHGELLDTQDMYTFARKFDMLREETRPKLNYEFVHCFPSLDMFVVDSTLADYFRYDIRHSTAAERNLPAQSIYI